MQLQHQKEKIKKKTKTKKNKKTKQNKNSPKGVKATKEESNNTTHAVHITVITNTKNKYNVSLSFTPSTFIIQSSSIIFGWACMTSVPIIMFSLT